MAIDWHGVFQISEWGQDKVRDSHIAALWDLQAEGFENHLVSYCGWKREQEVKEWNISAGKGVGEVERWSMP